MNLTESLVQIELAGSKHLISYFELTAKKPTDHCKTLVFIHGNSGDKNGFAHQLSYFSETNNVVALDLVGHGSSDALKAGEYSLELMGELVAKFVTELGLENVYLLGHSLGGHLAIQSLKYIGQDVLGLYIWGTPPLANPPAMDQAFLPSQTAGYLFTDHVSEQEVNLLYRDLKYVYGAQDSQDFLETFNKTDPRFRKEVVKTLGDLTFNDELALLEKFKGALGVLHGEFESLVNLDYINRVLPGVAVMKITHTGHYPHSEDSDLFNSTLEQLLLMPQNLYVAPNTRTQGISLY
jgi:pimeloyl-ACP methyl ester carboxylesterase